MVLFLAGGMAGAVDPDRFSAFQRALSQLDLPENHFLKATRILLHNSIASYAALWLGRAWGIFPALAALLNGAVGGAILALAIPRLGAGETAGAVVPHAIFELPAAFIAMGLGMWIGGAAWRGGREESRRRIRGANRAFLMVIFPLLLVAALIESR